MPYVSGGQTHRLGLGERPALGETRGQRYRSHVRSIAWAVPHLRVPSTGPLDAYHLTGPIGDRNERQKMVILRQPMNCWIESFSQTLVMRNSRYAVLTSGGDAPGMNAALRAVVGTGLNYGVETLGVRCGYKGLLEANFAPLTARED